MQCENTGFCSQYLVSYFRAACSLYPNPHRFEVFCPEISSPIPQPLMNSDECSALSAFSMDGNKFSSQLS